MFRDEKSMEACQYLVGARYVDNRGAVTETYPFNPNGSPQGITAVTTPDGRCTILMPHPERVFRTVAMSWHPRNHADPVNSWLRAHVRAVTTEQLALGREAHAH